VAALLSCAIYLQWMAAFSPSSRTDFLSIHIGPASFTGGQAGPAAQAADASWRVCHRAASTARISAAGAFHRSRGRQRHSRLATPALATFTIHCSEAPSASLPSPLAPPLAPLSPEPPRPKQIA
jgi:hypothetical protein